MKKLDGKIVRFIAVDPKYARVAYPAIAAESNRLSTFITGQHVDPEIPDTHGNLTRNEMLGIDEIKPASRKSIWPYVINPENVVQIIHSKPYDCRVDEKGRPLNPKDYAEAHFTILQANVAMNKDLVNKSKHKFYLEDKEAEAVNRIEVADLAYEAEKLIREKANVSEYVKLIKILNMTMVQFNETPEGLTELRMKDILIHTAKTQPEEIINLFSKQSKVYFYIIDLIDGGIIIKKRDGYYEGNMYVGANIAEMVRFISDPVNREATEKWNMKLRSKTTE